VPGSREGARSEGQVSRWRARPLSVLRLLAATGHHSKLAIAFTHLRAATRSLLRACARSGSDADRKAADELIEEAFENVLNADRRTRAGHA
jgi:hypothetical protein